MSRILKQIALASAVLGAVCAMGQSNIVTATVTITNIPTAAQTLVVNTDTRTWIASVTVPATQVLTGASIGAAATNLFNQVSTYPFAAVSLSRSGTNGIILQGAPGVVMSVTASGWATVSLATNTLSTAVALRLPITVETPANQTNLATLLATALDKSTYSPLGADIFWNNALTAAHNGVFVTNYTSGMTIYGTNVYTTTLWLQGQPAGGGWASMASTPAGLVLSSSGSVMLGAPLQIGVYTITGTQFSMGTNGYWGAFGTVSNGTWSAGTANGLTVTNLTLQDSTIWASNFTASGTITGTLSGVGKSIFGGGADVSFARYPITTLATGANQDVAVGTNVFVEVSGPGAAFSINGLANGRDGKLVIILNQTGYNLTFAHESGLEATATNRITSMTGADRATTGNGAGMLIYSGAAQRWILISLEQ